jgi:hypothetical protein
MAKRKPIDPEVRKKEMLETECREMREMIVVGILPLNPTRFFAVGERVQWGALEETYIRQIFEGGVYYLIESINVKRYRDQPGENEIRYMGWIDLYKYNQRQPTNFAKPEEHRINYLNSGISSLLNMVYHSGVDFNVDYQRDHVWTLDDKIALIDSIFGNVDIGKFTFVQRDFRVEGKIYEILDGKQRLSTIAEFVEGRFLYHGYTFAELSGYDKHRFEAHPISWGYLERPTKRAIFETFIKLNTCGRPMKNEDIDKVKKLLDEL